MFKQPGYSALSGIAAGTRILFANAPADGHFNPLTGLAVYLQQLGCDVRWYSSSQYEQKIGKLQIPFYPFKRALDWTGENLDQVFPERAKIGNKIRKLNYDMINAFILRSTEYYADISEIYKSFPFDIFIADNCFTAIPFVKEKIGVPVISIGVMPLTETSKDLAPAGLGMTPAKSWLGRRRQDLLRYLADHVLFRKPNRIMRTLLGEYGIDTGNCNLFDVICRKSDLLLQSGTPSFEYERSDLSHNIRFIGPLLPYSNKKHSAAWTDQRLTKYKKIILVTQGTVERDTEKIIIPVLEAFKDSDYLVVATTGGSDTSKVKSRYWQDNIIVEDFIPFEDIMPLADVYITNGGYGGVMLAIQHGLPMVVGGVHEGKNEINARIGYFNLGIDLGTERPTPARVRKAVLKVLADELYTTRVQALNKEFSRYDPRDLCAAYVASLVQPGAKEVYMHHNQATPPIAASL